MAHLIQRPGSHGHPIPKPTHFDPIIPTPIRARAYNDLYQHPECIKNSIKWNPNLMLVLIASESGSRGSRFDAGFHRAHFDPQNGPLKMARSDLARQIQYISPLSIPNHIPVRARAYNDPYQHPECIKIGIKWGPYLMLVLIASESGSRISRFDAGFNTPILRVKMGSHRWHT